MHLQNGSETPRSSLTLPPPMGRHGLAHGRRRLGLCMLVNRDFRGKDCHFLCLRENDVNPASWAPTSPTPPAFHHCMTRPRQYSTRGLSLPPRPALFRPRSTPKAGISENLSHERNFGRSVSPACPLRLHARAAHARGEGGAWRPRRPT